MHRRHVRFLVLWVRLTRPRSLTGGAAVCAGGVAKARSGANCASSAMSEAGAAEVARRRRHHVSALTSGGWRIFESKSGKGYLSALRRGCAFVPADSAACTV